MFFQQILDSIVKEKKREKKNSRQICAFKFLNLILPTTFSTMWHLNLYFLTTFAYKPAPITVFKKFNLYIFCYKYVCFVLP